MSTARPVPTGAGAPLVGRDTELALLRGLRTGGTARGVVLSGAPGVGTTRLAREYLLSWHKAGAATFRLSATPASAGLPLGVFAAYLPDSVEVDVPAARHTDLLRRCGAALREAAAGRRMVLAVDNVELLDDVSATLLRRLVDDEGAFMIATVARGRPLPAPVAALGHDGSVLRAEVAPLAPDAVERLVTGLLGGPVDKAVGHRLHRWCAGDLSCLHELVRAAVADGTLVEEHGLWRETAPPRPSPELAELVETRLAGPAAAEIAVLELLALGEPLTESELAELDALGPAERLERRGLLRCTRDETGVSARLAAPVHGLVLRERMPALRRARTVRALAPVLARRSDPAGGATGRSDPTGGATGWGGRAGGATGWADPTGRWDEDVLRLAGWQRERAVPGDDALLAGARIARERGDLANAEHLARAARDRDGGFAARLLAAGLPLQRGRVVEGEAGLRRLLLDAPDDAARARTATAWLDTWAFLAGRTDAAVRVAELTEPLLTDPDHRARLAERRAVLAAVALGPAAALPAISRLLAVADGAQLAWAAVPAARVCTRLGRLGDALRVSERGHAAHLAAPGELDWNPGVHVFLRVEALAQAGRLDEADRIAGESYRRAVAQDSTELQAWFATALCSFAAERGAARSAVVYGRTAVALWRGLARPRFEATARCHLGVALALSGQPGPAREVLAAVGPDSVDGGVWVAQELRARAWAAVMEDDPASARELLQRARVASAATGDLVGELAAVHATARLGDAAAARGRADELAGRIEGELAAARAGHVRALADADPGQLDRVSECFERCGALLLAAEAAAQAAGAWHGRGDARAAARAAYRCGALAQRCEDPVLPALRPVRHHWLTPAEREVAVRAASGWSNKSIAEELYVSRRTVEKQLEHVYGKLGVTGRRELAGVLSRG